MNLPSVKTLSELFEDSSTATKYDKAVKLRCILEGPGSDCERLEAADELLETFGVEHIERGHNAESPAIDYCNQGDPYTLTLMLINGRFVVGRWGDIVERGNYD